MQFLLWLRKSKLNKAGTAPIYLRIFLDTDTRSEYATGIRCRPEEWNAAKGRLRGNDEATRADNKRLKKLVSKAELKADRLQDAVDENPELPAVMPAHVALALRPKQKVVAPKLLALLKAALPSYSTKAGSREGAAHALRWFSQWPEAATLALVDLGPDCATRYAQWLAMQSPAASTRRVYLGTLAGLLAAAAPSHPRVFARLGRLQGKPVTKPRRPLPEGWQQQLLALQLPRVQSLARDALLLQYYLHGSRLGVILELQWAHVDTQQQRIQFTTHKYPVQMDIKVNPEVQLILAKYPPGCTFVLPLLPVDYLSFDDATRYKVLRKTENSVGVALKNIGKKLGWPHLHSHLARHTLALRSYQANGNDLRVPQKFLGHKHISTTAVYIASLDTSELDEAAAAVYGS